MILHYIPKVMTLYNFYNFLLKNIYFATKRDFRLTFKHLNLFFCLTFKLFDVVKLLQCHQML